MRKAGEQTLTAVSGMCPDIVKGVPIGPEGSGFFLKHALPHTTKNNRIAVMETPLLEAIYAGEAVETVGLAHPYQGSWIRQTRSLLARSGCPHF